MRGEASLSADRQSRDSLAPKLRESGLDTWRIGEELFVMTQLLDGNKRVEESLTDPSRPSADKVALLEDILGDQVHPCTLEVLSDLVRRRWSHVADIANAVEDFAVDAMMYYADTTDSTMTVSMELAQIESALMEMPILRSKLSDMSVPAQNREDLLHKVFEGNDLGKVTMRLIEHLACSPRHRRFLSALRWLIAKFSRHMGESMVIVTTATTPSPEYMKRLTDHFTRQLGRPAHINLVVDPSVLGGMRVQVGDEVTDRTVVAQLERLKRSVSMGV